MNIGLIGFGTFGGFHAAAIGRTEGSHLTAIACGSEASAARAREAHPQAEVVLDYRRLLERPEIDAVHIATPNHLHAEIGVAALEAGKHVLMEKPMAVTIEECDRLVEAARRTGKLLSTGFELRFSTQWGRVKALIDEGRIGQPVYANVALSRYPYRGGSGGWRLDQPRVGSWILEEPVHHFDFLLWYFETLGDPHAVRGYGNTRSGEAGKYDHFTSVMRWPGGAYALITMSLAAFEHHLLCEVVGTEGAIRTYWSGAGARDAAPRYELRLARQGQDEGEAIPLEASGELVELDEEIRRTHAAFREGRALVPPEESRKRVVMCLEAERSVQVDAELPLRF